MQDINNGTWLLIALYLLPAIIAAIRKHKNTSPLFIVNLFLGWTFLGWVGCLAWAFTQQEKSAPIEKQPNPIKDEYDLVNRPAWTRDQQLGKWIESPKAARPALDEIDASPLWK